MNPRWSITPSHPSAHHHHHRLPPLPPLPPPRWPPSRGPGPTRSLPRPPPTVPLPLLRRAVPRLRQRNKPRRHSPARRKKRKKRKQRRRGHKEEPPSWGSGRPTKTCWTSTASPSAATASTERRRSMDQSGEAESRGGGLFESASLANSGRTYLFESVLAIQWVPVNIMEMTPRVWRPEVERKDTKEEEEEERRKRQKKNFSRERLPCMCGDGIWSECETVNVRAHKHFLSEALPVWASSEPGREKLLSSLGSQNFKLPFYTPSHIFIASRVFPVSPD